MKICAECKWIIQTCVLMNLAKCGSSKAVLITNIVTGETDYPFCQLLRLFEKQCGPEGKWWEAK